MRIKGTFLADYVKLVNDTPDLEWKRFLVDSDWEVVHSLIIPTAWYDVGVMGRIGRGIFEMRVNRSYELVRLHGRSRATSFDPATAKFLQKGDPQGSLQAYVMIAARYIDEMEIKLERLAPASAEVSFFPVDGAPSWDLFREIQAGTMEQLVEMNGGQQAKAEILTQPRSGRQVCLIRLSWTPPERENRDQTPA